MGKRVIDDATLTAIADKIRENLPEEYAEAYTPVEMPSGIDDVANTQFNTGYENGYIDGDRESYEEGYNNGFNDGYSTGWDQAFPEGHAEGYANGYTEGYDAGYEAGLAADRNLFDWDTASFFAQNAYGANPTRMPTYEDGVWYSGGIYADSMGYLTCIPVEAGDIITFSADVTVASTKMTAGFIVGTSPTNGVFAANQVLINVVEGSDPKSGTRCWVVQIPEGYEWYGFSFAAPSRGQVELRNIVITKQNNALGEQAVAYNILMGVAE